MSESPLYLGFSRSTGGFFSRAFGRAIRVVTGGRVNHAFFLWRDDCLGWVTLGANANGVTLMTIEKFLADREIVSLYLPHTGSFWRGLARCKQMIDEGYDFSGLAGIGVAILVRRWIGARLPNWLSGRGRIFCSAFAAEVIHRANLQVGLGTAQFLLRANNLVAPAPLNHVVAADMYFAPFVWTGAPVPLAEVKR